MDSAPSRRPLSTAHATRPVPPAFGGAPRPLHILIVGWEFPPNHTGGLGVHSFELCQELTRLGHRVTFVSPSSGPFTPVQGVTFRHPGEKTGGPSPEFPPAYWAGGTPDSPFTDSTDGYNSWVSELKTTDPFDVVHVHDWFGTVGAAALARRLHLPLIMTVHSTEYDRSLGHPWEHILHR
ncbi:MAG: glycosyltransferase, partial [Thermoplasmata archaeon]